MNAPISWQMFMPLTIYPSHVTNEDFAILESCNCRRKPSSDPQRQLSGIGGSFKTHSHATYQIKNIISIISFSKVTTLVAATTLMILATYPIN